VSVRSGGAAYARLRDLHESVWVAPSAQLYGKIAIGAGSSVWHNAVARAECEEIRIGRVTNVQDFVMLHVGYAAPTVIGDFCTLAHRATLHGCTLGDACLVGPGALVMDGALVGAGSIVAGGAVVPEGKRFPPHSILAGVPARRIGERDCARENRRNAWLYLRNAEFTRRGDYRAWEGPEYQEWLAALAAELPEDRDLLRLSNLSGASRGRV
jgi:carbonic anhydrase/acetyltransferase-like protein (isoleucine patch superfamily)